MYSFPAIQTKVAPRQARHLLLMSKGFVYGGMIPERYTGDGININPPLSIGRLPLETESLVLIVEDPDAPIHKWVHWLVWNIPVTDHIAEGSVPGVEGLNSFNRRKYCGPCPPRGVHRYFFKVYALDTKLSLPGNATKADVEKAMRDHVLSMGELMGKYERGGIKFN